MDAKSRETKWTGAEGAAAARRKLAVGLVLATAVAGAAARLPSSETAGGATGAAASGGPVTFAATLDKKAVLVGGSPNVRLELVMGAPSAAVERAGVRVATDLVVVLDRSGSMGGDKIEHARAAIGALVSQLSGTDRFALVTYSNDAATEIPLAEATDAAKAAWLARVAGVMPGGGTNLSSGLDLAVDLVDRTRAAGRAPRVILVSDGLANQGDASPEGLVRRAARAARGEYALTTVGVGADFNEALLTTLADAGTGNYYYLRSAQGLDGVLAREFGAARETVASGLEVRIEPGPGVTVLDAAGYPLERTGGTVVFRPGSLFAGQERRAWVTLAVPNGAAAEHELGRFSLAYTHEGRRSTAEIAGLPRVASVAAEKDFYAGVDAAAWSRSVVVDRYNHMQERVAAEVKAGRKDAALAAVREFRTETDAMNRRIGSAPVQSKLESLRDLEVEVSAAFEGAGQEAKQNALAKSRGAAALDERRVGAKKK